MFGGDLGAHVYGGLDEANGLVNKNTTGDGR